MIHDYYLSLTKLVKNIDDQISEVGKKKKEIMGKLNDHQDYNFYPTNSDLKNLPEDSTLLKISFTLKKPYTSKDEGEFNIIDNKIFENPIVRDKFTGLPMMKPTTWKGHLRFAANKVEWQNEQEKKIIIKRLFGSEPEEKDNPLKGRLYFFPTFFNEDAEKDVITPLKRDTRTPTKRGPISLEVMKPGKKGDFHLLYFPYPRGDEFKEEEIKKDLPFLAKALELMFYTYGFSAKKTSGFGVIERLKDSEVEVKPCDKRELFSILYTEHNENIKDGS
ncbi:MAG TPA: RAMP superfamily CRISPR-associated protein [Bacteroidales bacterium]|nr:RAMP superfamily CRISPR-associated protein [Bacteroidales bacterium]HPZ61201.1 RAMP superfamily CRISPR-associated protein [Bacteroidales bacterium]HQD58352.1 RAMP superfamily CRISPR-associated protein [Bacteroidales bacterium]